ncbi:T9SS type A sorting domain-containing protein [Chitinophaga sp.]|uniref:T9SS type A sorting domain-containing protein n=1 Tax=Chitinophaga sp. TaxID=1869181 RepID=UPI0031E42A27
MKTFILLTGILMSCITQPLKAQYDTTQYFGKMEYIFQHIDRTPITTGILLDYGFELLNFDNYTGAALHDSNYVGISEWRQLYGSLYMSQISTNTMQALPTVNNQINAYNYTSMPITFAGLYMNYQKLRDDAITANLMTVSNDQIYDVPGRTSSPYLTKELFAIAPIRQAAFIGDNNFIFRPELFYSNTGKTISTIGYRIGEGTSYTTVAFNTTFTVNLPTTGFYDIAIQITYTDNSIRIAHTKIVAYQPLKDPNQTNARYGPYESTPPTNETVTATKLYQGLAAEGDITIDLAANNTTGQIRKPLIMIEGFDGASDDPTKGFTYNGAGGLLYQLSVDGNSNTYITLNEGLDNINNYDLIFLNFHNSRDYIQRNAYLVEKVIQLVNSRKTTFNGARQENVIIGMSMGGLCVRYALRDMELNSQAHETRLFVSHDVPHWGANIPVGAQAMVQHLAPYKIINVTRNFSVSWVDMFPALVSAQDMFNSPAAKQMMIQRYLLIGDVLLQDNNTHDAFYNEMNTMGWPVNCRNITISNGACSGATTFPDNSTIFTMDGSSNLAYFEGIWKSFVLHVAGYGTALGLVNGYDSPTFNSWALLRQFPLSLISTKYSFNVDFKLRAVPSTGTQEIYRADVFTRKKVLFLINVTNYIMKMRVNSNTSMLPLDNAPGGVYNLNYFGLDAGQIAKQLPDFLKFATVSILQPQFCFIPTVSSLAINDPVTYLNRDICDIVNCANATSVQDFYAPTVNMLHISYSQAATNWLLQRQAATFNCIKACKSALSITGDNVVCSTSTPFSINNFPTGASLTWSISSPSVASISSSGIMTKLNNGVIQLNAAIGNLCGADANITKTVTVGTPAAVLSSPEYRGQDYVIRATPVPGATGYLWTEGNSAGTISTSPNYGSSVGCGVVVRVGVQVINACGTSAKSSVPVSVRCTGGGTSMATAIFPNPAQNIITIAAESEATYDNTSKAARSAAQESITYNTAGIAKNKAISEVQVYTMDGKMVLRKKYTEPSGKVNLDVSKLSNGNYLLQVITSGNASTTRQIIIQH